MDRFVKRHPDFAKKFALCQEWSRKAAGDNVEAHAHFLKMLAHVVQRTSVKETEI